VKGRLPFILYPLPFALRPLPSSSMNTRVFALGCHSDDIEFMMGSTLFLLQEANCELHYMNLANGSCGTTEYRIEEIVSIRRQEAQNEAASVGAAFYESLVNDLEVFYTQELIRQVAAIIRKIKPHIMLIPSLEDYMEDQWLLRIESPDMIPILRGRIFCKILAPV
jgi:LmbE family N-acetylglucosaminyl deacetylase